MLNLWTTNKLYLCFESISKCKTLNYSNITVITENQTFQAIKLYALIGQLKIIWIILKKSLSNTYTL